MELKEIGTINEVDERYVGIISGNKDAGGPDYSGIQFEIWIPDTMEVLWHPFTFGMNPAALWDGAANNIKEYSFVMSDGFCRICGIEPDYLFDTVCYGKLESEGSINYDVDDNKFVGKEIGVLVGDHYGERVIKGFFPPGELLTMAVPD